MAEEEMAEEEMAEEEMAFADVCPAKIVVQTNWFPEAEHGGTYQVIGPDGTIDGANGTYSGPLADTGLELEIRSGSQFIGFQPVTSAMYQDPDIFFGYVDGGEAIQQSGANPTVAVMANLDISPLAMLWDPETYDFTSIEDIRDEGVTVLHFDPSVSIEYFVETGQLSRDQTDASFDGSPAVFLASNWGNRLPEFRHQCSVVVREGDCPTGVSPSTTSWSTTSAGRSTSRRWWFGPTRSRLTGIVSRCWYRCSSRAGSNYMNDPVPVNNRILEIVEAQATFWSLSEELNADAITVMRDLDIVSNGPDGTFGNFDMDRIPDADRPARAGLRRGGRRGQGRLAGAEDIATNGVHRSIDRLLDRIPPMGCRRCRVH